MKHPARIIFIIQIILTLGLTALRLIISNNLTTLGKSVKEADEKIVIITEQNQDLRQQIASYSSLLVIEEKASKLGLNSRPKTLSIWPGSDSVALKLQ